jgi:hypothetical protein
MDTFTARTPIDLLALVPIVIGFHPENSVVFLTFGAALDGDRRPGSERGSFHARVDLPVVDHEQQVVADMLLEVSKQHRVGMAAVVVYSSDAEIAGSFADLLVPSLLASGVDVLDVLRAEKGQYFRIADPEDLGTRYDLRSHPLTASGVLEGRVVHPSRAALRETLVGADDTDAAAVAAAADAFASDLIAGSTEGPLVIRFAAEGRWLQETLARRVATRGLLSVDEAGRMLVLLSFDSLREIAWSDLLRCNASAYVELLSLLVRRAPDEFASGVSGLLGLAAWLAGDGALAWCAVDRCHRSDPSDTLAEHVAALLESATPPTVWRPLSAESLPVFRAAVDRGATAGDLERADHRVVNGSGSPRRGSGRSSRRG